MAGIADFFKLENMRSHNSSLGPGDKVLLVCEGAMSGSSISCDISNLVRDGSVVHVFAFKPVTVSSSGTITVTASVAGASDSVKVLIMVDQKDLKYAGE